MLQPNTPHKPRLLVLDEDRILLQSLSAFLRREGYEVQTCDRPRDVLTELESHQSDVLPEPQSPQSALLLADVNLPGLKPAEFLRDVKRRFPHVVTIVITGYGSI